MNHIHGMMNAKGLWTYQGISPPPTYPNASTTWKTLTPIPLHHRGCNWKYACIRKQWQEWEGHILFKQKVHFHRKVILCTCLGCTEIETYHHTFPNMGGSNNGPIEVSLWETCFEWKIVKMVDLVNRIWFEVCGYENYQMKHRVKFLCQESYRGGRW